MISEQDVLTALDHANDGYYCHFISLNHPYVYLIDTRLSLFRSGDEWAIAAEILGFPPRGGFIELNIYYYGNCLVNLEQYNNRPTNTYTVYPIDEASFQKTAPEEFLNPTAATMLIRDVNVPVQYNKEEYAQAGIELTELEPDRIELEELARLLITKHPDLFRATDAELYKFIPAHLSKVLVLDEWHHKDFTVSPPKVLTDQEIVGAYELNTNIGGLHGISCEDLAALICEQEGRLAQQAQQEWNSSRPGSYETWQQLAKVLATGDVRHYQPTLPPNTHWSNWPESGAL
ncbi:DUF7003 family protein [Hymenobacter metallicola]|uniref:Uncharacterized protein n=1 Tax=Hymenobacter metallicola TaxID=2563114 RepID=A0A4Z0QGD5_9BACT|nr:hypothetical protein [Hymenobacter metallicola]TGE29080.1 hypothetical protein E5K02_06390 [Hymenobacter metallicola]